jgi:methionine-rich copper-binding protein CopC
MKKALKLLLLSLVMTMVLSVTAVPVFAAGTNLSLTESHPEDNDTHMQVDNASIKLRFDGDVTAEGVQSVNKDCFILSTGKKDKKVDTDVFFNEKEKYILVSVTSKVGSLKPDTDYKLTISGELVSADKKLLGEDVVLKFKTVDTAGNTKIYMLLMGVMIVAMILMNMFSARRKAKAAADAGEEVKVNPYKYAKEKGISVQEAMDRIEKDRARRAKKTAQTVGKDPNQPVKKTRGVRKRVKGPRPISGAGSTYKSGSKPPVTPDQQAKREAELQAKISGKKSKKKKK